jgi:hypothetical protein
MRHNYLTSRINKLKYDTLAVSRVAMGVAVVVIVVAAGTAAIFFMSGGSTSTNLAAGDFLKYERVETMGDSHLEYTYWLNVTAVDSTGFDMQITTFLNGGLYSQSSPHLTKIGILTYFGTWSGKVDLGPMTISTSFGSRNVEHYQYQSGGTTWEIYVGNNGVLYKYTTSIGSQTGETILTESSLSWV